MKDGKEDKLQQLKKLREGDKPTLAGVRSPGSWIKIHRNLQRPCHGVQSRASFGGACVGTHYLLLRTGI